MYNKKYYSKIKKDLSKIDKPVHNKFLKIHRDKILENPENAEKNIMSPKNKTRFCERYG